MRKQTTGWIVHKGRLICRLIYLALIIWIVLPIYAANAPEKNPPDPAELFKMANEFYQKENYHEAALTYQKMIQNGYKSGNVYYNLGNTYFKLKDNGYAILYYEKARRLIPLDRDLKNNLAIALSGVDEGAVGWPARVYEALVFLAPLNLLLVFTSIALFFYVLTLCLEIVFLSRPGKSAASRFKIPAIITGIIFVLALSFSIMVYFNRGQKQGVVVATDAEIFFEPNLQANSVYLKPDEGTRLYILETRGDWSFVKRRDGKKGWILRSCYQEI